MALTTLQLEKAPTPAKLKKVYDAGGLYCELTPAGGKNWKLKFTYGGKEKKLSLGSFPTIGLARARQLRDEALERLAAGFDPAAEKQARKVAAVVAAEPIGNTFAAVHERLMMTADIQAQRETTRIAKQWGFRLCAALHELEIAAIGSREIVETLEGVMNPGNGQAARGTQSRNKAWRCIKSVFAYAELMDLIAVNPCDKVKRGYKMTVTNQPHAAIIEAAPFGALLRDIWDYKTHQVTVPAALRLLPLVFTRPGELRKMEWREVDTDRGLWIIPKEKMKMALPHVVPLSTQAVEIIEGLREVTGKGQFVFAGRCGSRPISENTMNQALKALGYPASVHVPHGFRSSASTLLNAMRMEGGAPRFHPEAIEFQLAHGDPNKVRANYQRNDFLKERAAMMQFWADYLDTLRKGAKVLPLAAAA